MNVKQTLINLHKAFPNLSLDDLFKILDCYVEKWDTPLTRISYDRTTGTDNLTTNPYNNKPCTRG